MKKVAIIIQKLSGGGAERTASNLSIFLSEKAEVHLIIFDGSNITYPYKGTLHDLKLPPADSLVGKIKTLFFRISKIRQIKKQYSIDTTISLMEGANLVNCFARTGDKIITSVRNQKSKATDGTRGFLLKSIQKVITKRSDLIISLSDGVKKDLINVYKVPETKIVTIYNPCDGNLLREEAKIHADDTVHIEPMSIITMGRLTTQKGQWHLIRAFKKIKQEIPDAKLYILGEGEFKERLESLAKELDVADNTEFLGYREAPHSYIASSAVFAFPSLFEGLGNVILETLACGVPCVASDCYSGPREILAPETEVKEILDDYELAEFGILTSVCGKGEFDAVTPLTKEENQLADALIKLLSDEELRRHYKDKALGRAKDFLPEKIMEEWNKVI